MDMQRSLGLDANGFAVTGNRRQSIRYINLRLASLGIAVETDDSNREFLTMAHDLLATHREQMRLLSKHLCPADQRIQDFLDHELANLPLVGPVRLPNRTFVLDRHGLARELSMPVEGDSHQSDILHSYRTAQGVLHNPKSDRRTTQGVFHVASGGLPVPADKKEVPLVTYGNLLHYALNPPTSLLKLPFAAGSGKDVDIMTSLLLRPVVMPEVPGTWSEKTMEVRFFAPGSLVSNLDFVESIFGNAGDPFLPDNDAGLDTHHWTGTTGCVILAPHLTTLKKKDLGLPHYDKATERQRHDGMCWKNADELYNDGSAFKITHRTMAGVMVTILADNYYGYCKKEVKTQIGFSANLFGLAEEEHAGGALAFPSYNLGDEFRGDESIVGARGQTFAELVQRNGDLMDVQPSGYAIDRQYSDIYYVPENVRINLPEQIVSWEKDGKKQQLPLRAGITYVHPSGYKVHLEKHPGAPSWRLVGTTAEGTFCHKPCTVSGGGKSEISKPITDAVIYGPIFVKDFDKDMNEVEALCKRDYSDRMLPHLRHDYSKRPTRPLLSQKRSLGSVIKMLTPSPGEFTDEYNSWLETIPPHIRALTFIVKRFYRPEWGTDWRSCFSVDIINGRPGHELKFGDRKPVGSYLRVGLMPNGSWRTFKLRQDFIAAQKVQMEDDISASIVVPSKLLPALGDHQSASVKLVKNCEYRLFQRPDDAIHRGYDKVTEEDMARDGLFCSNFEPLDKTKIKALVDDVVGLDQFTQPMRSRVEQAVSSDASWLVSSAHPRMVGGKPTKNPRYLQVRPDLVAHRQKYLASIGTRLFRKLKTNEMVLHPVNAVLPGRRNNPPDHAAGIRQLAVYSPIHYQELPELFMDFVASLSGKSPSTTSAGSEGALTKGPFNAVRATADLNNALVSYILCDFDGFTSATGHVGPNVQVDHDISLLIPEIWCRLPIADRDPTMLIREGHLEQVKDFTHKGRTIEASRLGYRITSKFVHTYFGKIFDTPEAVFSDDILRPEKQNIDDFAAGVEYIIESQRLSAIGYFDDGSIEDACPPLAAVLHCMVHGHYLGKSINDPSVRALFTKENLLASDWYRRRLHIKQEREIALWKRHAAYLQRFLQRDSHADEAHRLDIAGRLAHAEKRIALVSAPAYLDVLHGTIGADPMGKYVQTMSAKK
jgi:phosphoenolpyruvate carboxykinase (diphosphate)